MLKHAPCTFLLLRRHAEGGDFRFKARIAWQYLSLVLFVNLAIQGNVKKSTITGLSLFLWIENVVAQFSETDSVIVHFDQAKQPSSIQLQFKRATIAGFMLSPTSNLVYCSLLSAVLKNRLRYL